MTDFVSDAEDETRAQTQSQSLHSKNHLKTYGVRVLVKWNQIQFSFKQRCSLIANLPHFPLHHFLSSWLQTLLPNSPIFPRFIIFLRYLALQPFHSNSFLSKRSMNRHNDPNIHFFDVVSDVMLLMCWSMKLFMLWFEFSY